MSIHTPLEELITQYVKNGKLTQLTTLQGGLINATYLTKVSTRDAQFQFVFQRVNTTVFRKPEQVMANIEKVTTHLKKVAPKARNLDLKLTLEGSSYVLDNKGGLWRAFDYLEGCVSHECARNKHDAYQGGKAFGSFLTQMSTLDASQLHETIPNFHHTPRRLQALEKAIRLDSEERVKTVTQELKFINKNIENISKIEHLREQGLLPLRTTHNDTKISNILFDAKSSESICVVDLDTVMPGTMLYDFGDLVRTTINSAPEDAPIGDVQCRMDFFQALTEGYLKYAGQTLVKEEIELLVFSAKLITLELAIRFLTDYLNGDQYFKVSRKTQNLERARNQLQLVTLIEKNQAEMESIVHSLSSRFLLPPQVL